MSGDTSISQQIEKQHEAIQQIIRELQKLSHQAQAKHTNYAGEFSTLKGVCYAILDIHAIMHPPTMPGLIQYYKAILKAITAAVASIQSKPKTWSACETTSEHATYIMHALENVIRSFLNLLSMGHVNANTHADYFFHTPHHEKPEVQEFKNLLTELNATIETLTHYLFSDTNNTQAPI
tara:strand:+ start:414 stop:950 length:537 start_codon:yes stop_codon:yes gene_type:complete